MRIVFYLIIGIIQLQNMNAQEKFIHGKRPDEKMIVKHQNALNKKFSKTKCSESENNFNFLFLNWYGFKNTPTKSLLLDKDLVHKLDVLYKSKEEIPYNYTIVYNHDKNVVGYVEYFNQIYCFENDKGALYKKYEALLKFYFDKEPDRIFQIDASSTEVYFAEKNGQLKVLTFDENLNLLVKSIEEIVNCCWEDLFPQEIVKIYYPNFCYNH